MSQYPTEWQRKILWGAFTTLAVVAVGAAIMWIIGLFGQAVSFLQPVLIPFAVAAVLAFLLEPIVRLITARTRFGRRAAVVVVLSLVVLLVALLVIAVVPQIYDSSARVVRDMPAYTKRAQQRLLALVEITEKKLNQINRLLPVAKPSPTPVLLDSQTASADDRETQAVATPAASPTFSTEVTSNPSTVTPAPTTGPADAATAPEPTPEPASATRIRDYIQTQLPELGQQVPAVLNTGLHLLMRSIGGVMGAFGLLLNAVIVPVYLYFLLVESRNIARNWSGFLPMHDSALKQEVVSVILEINGYLVAFFRGQLIVSTIDGILIGSSLFFFVHLDFSFFITLLVIVLTFIPYLGIILCYVPALLIAVLQYGDWQHPAAVVLIMFIVQTLESTIISPKIVGDSVGLHPMTVIISVFGWSLLLGGPIGAILAVPLTATLKVLMRRYVWERGVGPGRQLVPLTASSSVPPVAVARDAADHEHRDNLAFTEGTSSFPDGKEPVVAPQVGPPQPSSLGFEHEPAAGSTRLPVTK